MTGLSLDPTLPFTADSAHLVSTAACQQIDLPAEEVQLIRLGSNAVFRLNGDDIARVATRTDSLPNARLQIDVARWLADAHTRPRELSASSNPSVSPATPSPSGSPVAPETFYAPIDRVADLIRRLHDLAPPAGLRLPVLQPLGATGRPVLR